MRFELCTVNHVLQCSNRILRNGMFLNDDDEIKCALLNGERCFSCQVCICVCALRHIKHKSNCHIIPAVDVYVNIEIFVVYIYIFAGPHARTHTHTPFTLTFASYASSIWRAYTPLNCVHNSREKNLSFAIMSSHSHQCDNERDEIEKSCFLVGRLRCSRTM